MSHKLVGNRAEGRDRHKRRALRGRRCNHRSAGGDEMNVAANQGAYGRVTRRYKNGSSVQTIFLKETHLLGDPQRRPAAGYRGIRNNQRFKLLFLRQEGRPKKQK